MKGVPTLSPSLECIALQGFSPMCGRMLRQHPSPGPDADRTSLLFRNSMQITESFLWPSAEEDFCSGREKGGEALPVIADHRRRTSGRLEKPDAGRIAGLQKVVRLSAIL